MKVLHEIAPVYDADSRLLILGSFPSVKSRESCFFYGHPRNRFWRVFSAVYEYPLPLTVEEKRIMLLNCRVALWDVISECDIEGSADSSIRNAKPNDVSRILSSCRIGNVYLNGSTAGRLYDKLILPHTGVGGTVLPSTSPLNASWSLERLIDAWSVIRRT